MRKIIVIYKLFISRVLGKHLPSFCRVCGRTVHDFSVADDIWEKVDPYIKYGHTLCYDCFCEICWKLGLPSVWELTSLGDKE